MSNYSKNAEDIIKYIGEGKNIEEVKHCFTRLRFKVKDNSKVNVEMLEKIPCVVRVMKTMGQIQVVVGNEIDEVYKAVEKYLEGTSIDVSKLEEPVETKEEKGPKGIQYYCDLIDELKANDIEPIVTLYHYDLPMALVDKYDGWISREVVKDFEYYARYIINEFKNKVKYWTTINEQSIIVQFIEQKCYIPEKYKGNNQIRYQINHHMNLAHAIACKLVHELVPNGLVGAAIGYAPVYPLTSKPEDVMAAQNANDLHNQYYLDIYFKGHYTKSAMIYLEKTGMAPKIEPGDMELIKEGYSDFLALNYYASECAKACPEDGKEICFAGVNRSGKKGEMAGYETQPGFFEMCKNPNLDTTDWDWAIDPTGLEYIFRDIYCRYEKPLMITENGLGAYDELTEDGKIHDEYRIDYLRAHIKAMKKAMDYGVEVLAYCPWSAVDLLSTSNGVKKRYGFIYVDRTDDDPKECARIRKDSFYWYQKVIQSQGTDLES